MVLFHKKLVKFLKSACLVSLLMLLAITPVLGQEKNDSPDIFAEIVDFVVSQDSSLNAQQKVMEAAYRLDTVVSGDNTNIPSYAQSSLLQMKYDNVTRVQLAEQTYSKLMKDLISALSNDLVKIFSLRNKILNQKELHSLLAQRLEPTERQVQAGIIPESVLWELSERLINVQIVTADAESQLRILEQEIAFNYGGESWQELLALLKKLN